MTWGGFSAALKHAVENKLQHWVAGAEKHMQCILMTCHSLWKSLCAPEHEEWLKYFMSMLGSSVLQKRAGNTYEAAECCFTEGTNTVELYLRGKNLKRHFSTAFSSNETSGHFCLYHLCWYGKVSFLIWHILDWKKTPQGSLGIRLPNVLGLLESAEEKYK